MFIDVYARVLSGQIYAIHRNKRSGTRCISPSVFHRGRHDRTPLYDMFASPDLIIAAAGPPPSSAYAPAVGLIVQPSQPLGDGAPLVGHCVTG